jgi:predicted cation transporter
LLIGLIIILLLVLTLPFFVKAIERNLEPFLFVMGLAATIISGVFSSHLVKEIFTNHLMYMITAAVLIFGLLFKVFQDRVQQAIEVILRHIPLKVFVFLVVVVLGLISSMITAIIAALLLVEIINNLPLSRKDKINIDIIACFAIGLGAALTPIGEPLSTIVISKLNADFWYLAKLIGIFIIPGILAMGLLGTVLVGKNQAGTAAAVSEAGEAETYTGVVLRAGKIFLFIMALELLGAGFKPLIDTYIIHLDGRVLYWINMISAILDNATLAAAEISPEMSGLQIEAILMGLLVSGGMLIPGNIPNIISAGKLKITSSEWARLGIPLGLALLVIYYLIIFIIL